MRYLRPAAVTAAALAALAAGYLLVGPVPPPAPVRFSDVSTRWEGGEWVVRETVESVSACGPGAWLVRSFVLASGAAVPAEPSGASGGLDTGVLVRLAGLRPGVLGPVEVRFRPPPEARGYLVEVAAPAGACPGGFAGRRPVLSLDVRPPPPRP